MISFELDLFVPSAQLCTRIIVYVRTYVFSLRHRTCSWWKDIFLKTNGLEHCFLAPAKLPLIAILNNFVNKIVTALQKSLKLLL